MKFAILPAVVTALVMTAGTVFAAPDRADSGHHPIGLQGRPIDSAHDRSPPGPHGRARFNRFDTFHNIFVSPRRFRVNGYHKPSGWYYKLWGLGEFLPATFTGQSYWIDNYRAYDLARPPFGCVWVRYGNDAILLDKRTGEVLRVVREVFY